MKMKTSKLICTLTICLFALISGSSAIAKTSKVQIVLFAFSDSPLTSNYTPADAWSTVFTYKGFGSPYTLPEFISHASYGLWTLAGKTSTDGKSDLWPKRPAYWNSTSRAGFYQTQIPTSQGISAGSTAALNLAKADGMQINSDDLIIVASIRGNQTIGGSTDFGRNISMMSSLENSAWANVIHEIGHQASMGHSKYLQCHDPYGNRFTGFGTDLSFQNCTSVEYGGIFSLMGGYSSIKGETGRLWDGENRLEAGFLPQSSIQTITQSATYLVKKINTTNATFISIPFEVKTKLFGGAIVEKRKLSVEARDFESWELDTDNSPGIDFLSLKTGGGLIGDELVGPAYKSTSNGISPQQSVSLPELGIKISNLGPGTANDVRVKVELDANQMNNLYATTFENFIEANQFKQLIPIDAQGNMTQPQISFKSNAEVSTFISITGTSQYAAGSMYTPAFTTCPTMLGKLGNAVIHRINNDFTLAPAASKTWVNTPLPSGHLTANDVIALNQCAGGSKWIFGYQLDGSISLLEPGTNKITKKIPFPEKHAIWFYFYHGYSSKEIELLTTPLASKPKAIGTIISVIKDPLTPTTGTVFKPDPKTLNPKK